MQAQLAPVERNAQGRWVRPDPLLDVSQSRIVKLTGIDKSILSRILSGRRMARLDEAVLISDATGVSVSALAQTLIARHEAHGQADEPTVAA